MAKKLPTLTKFFQDRAKKKKKDDEDDDDMMMGSKEMGPDSKMQKQMHKNHKNSKM